MKNKAIKIKYKEEIFSKISNGSIIRLKHKKGVGRDWICIHYTKINKPLWPPYRKNIKNHSGYYLLGGPWYPGDLFTSDPYGKTWGMLEMGMLPDIEIVGHLSNKEDLEKYKLNEKV